MEDDSAQTGIQEGASILTAEKQPDRLRVRNVNGLPVFNATNDFPVVTGAQVGELLQEE